MKLSKLMTLLHFQQRPLGQQWLATAEKTDQQWVPRQYLKVLRQISIANPFHYRSVAVGGFLEDGTSLPQTWGMKGDLHAKGLELLGEPEK